MQHHRPDADEVENRLPVISAIARAATRESDRHGRSRNAAPRRLRKIARTPWSSSSAASGTPSPSRSARAKSRMRENAGKRRLREKVPSPLFRSTRRHHPRRDDEVEVPLGVDVGRPDAVQRTLVTSAGSSTVGGDVRESSLSVWLKIFRPPAPAKMRSVRKS